MKLSFNELSEVFEITIRYLLQQNVKSIAFWNDDFYLVTHSNEHINYNSSKTPVFGLGSLDHDLEVWQEILSNKKEAVYEISGETIRKLGAILTAFGQVSDQLDNPHVIKNVGSRRQSAPQITVNELNEIFDLVLQTLKMWYKAPDVSFKDPNYIKVALKDEYLNMTSPPYTMGSLNDALTVWKEILTGTRKPSACAIEKLGDLLTAFGEEISAR